MLLFTVKGWTEIHCVIYLCLYNCYKICLKNFAGAKIHYYRYKIKQKCDSK